MVEGANHYKRNASIYDYYSKKHGIKIMYLSDIRMQDDHLYHLNEMNSFYHSSKEFRETVEGFLSMYVGRVAERRNLDDDQAEFCKSMAKDYLLMESAMFCQLRKMGWKSLSYAGSIQTFSDIANGKIPGAPELLMSMPFISLRLKHSGWTETQVFECA